MCEEHSSPPKYDIDPTTSATRSSSTYFPSPCMELRQSTIDSPNTLRKQLLKEPSEHGIGENELVEMEKGGNVEWTQQAHGSRSKMQEVAVYDSSIKKGLFISLL